MRLVLPARVLLPVEGVADCIEDRGRQEAARTQGEEDS